MDRKMYDEAYNFAISKEHLNSHRDSLVWYQILCELFGKCKIHRQADGNFWIFYTSALERYATLSVRVQGALSNKDISEAAHAILNLDRALFEMKSMSFANASSTFAENVLNHMWAQLHFHMACLIMRKTLRERGSWTESSTQFFPLLLTAMQTKPFDLAAPWIMNLKDQTKQLVSIMHKEAAYRWAFIFFHEPKTFLTLSLNYRISLSRCSQAGHVMHDLVRNNVKSQMDKIAIFCCKGWRERLYKKVFVAKINQAIENSFFVNHKPTATPGLHLYTPSELITYDIVSESVYPSSLHHLVWLGVNSAALENGPHPYVVCNVFPELQFSIYNLTNGSPESLSRLDIDGFLNAVVFSAYATLDQKQRRILSAEQSTLPADLMQPLCTVAQEKWWNSAYKIYSKNNCFGNIGAYTL